LRRYLPATPTGQQPRFPPAAPMLLARHNLHSQRRFSK
jgi:hypothetical protein